MLCFEKDQTGEQEAVLAGATDVTMHESCLYYIAA